VLVAVIAALLRWIDQLSKLGQVSAAIDEAAEATRKALTTTMARRAPLRPAESL